MNCSLYVRRFAARPCSIPLWIGTAVLGTVFSAIAHATPVSVTFKQNADVLSSDGTIDITNYQGAEDTSIFNNGGTAAVAQNAGGDGRLFLGSLTDSDGARRPLIRFEVGSLEGLYSSIESITLRFFTQAPTTNANAARLYRVAPGTFADGNGDWVEGNFIAGQTSTNGSSTWQSKHGFGFVHASNVDWAGSDGMSTLGVDHIGAGVGNDPLATLAYDSSITAGTAVEFEISGIDLTALIDDWIDAEMNDTFGNQKNEGLFLITDFVDSSQIVLWSSEENDGANFEPELEITYTPIPEPPAVALTLLGLLGLAVWRPCRARLGPG